jgi:hypothetical protein
MEGRVADADRQLSWMRRLYLYLGKSGSGWKAILPSQVRQQKLARVLKRDGHFDGEAYLAKYADVAEAGMNPLRHYVLHGMAEGRIINSQP